MSEVDIRTLDPESIVLEYLTKWENFFNPYSKIPALEGEIHYQQVVMFGFQERIRAPSNSRRRPSASLEV